MQMQCDIFCIQSCTRHLLLLPPQVLAPLGADVSGSQFLDPDGMFPNHIPNPEHPSAMKAATEAVLASKSDLGIVFDTDVDRAAIVGKNGQPIDRNRMIALMAAIALRDYPGSTIVTDSVTSNGLAAFIKELGGKHLRCGCSGGITALPFITLLFYVISCISCEWRCRLRVAVGG